MKPDTDLLQTLLAQSYTPAEHPALQRLIEHPEALRPLRGRAILDATPLFRNTLVKHLALLRAGATLTVATSDAIPHDPAILPILDACHIPHTHNCSQPDAFDLILDCAGAHAHLRPRLGFVELTRSGAWHFQHADRPVILVDDSRTKTIETGLGTGDGFVRALSHLGLGSPDGRRLVVFGCGKVGSGIAFHAARLGAHVTAVDDTARIRPRPGVRLVDLHDEPAVLAAVARAWCVVSATGRAGALASMTCVLDALRQGTQLVANMGVEDEWGPDLPDARVLNAKRPLNFCLPEPTLLRYIDPTMALSNLAAATLAAQPQDFPNGLSRAPEALEQDIWRDVRQHGLIADMLDAWLADEATH